MGEGVNLPSILLYSQSFCILLLQDFPSKNPAEKSKLCLSFSIRNPQKFQGWSLDWSLAESVKLAKDSPWKYAKNPIKRIIFQPHLFSQIRCSFSGSSDSPPHLLDIFLQTNIEKDKHHNLVPMVFPTNILDIQKSRIQRFPTFFFPTTHQPTNQTQAIFQAPKTRKSKGPWRTLALTCRGC